MAKRINKEETGKIQMPHFKEKRKWQIALRRYILDGNKCSYYAPFFAVDRETFRQWIALQFDEDLDWHNFSTGWQFDHVVPMGYFDFDNEDDMRLCWNFTNIRVDKNTSDRNHRHRIEALSAKSYFLELFDRTKYPICGKMIEKIEEIEAGQIQSQETLENFILQKQDYLLDIASFDAYQFDQLNGGVSAETIKTEKEFLKKFG